MSKTPSVALDTAREVFVSLIPLRVESPLSLSDLPPSKCPMFCLPYHTSPFKIEFGYQAIRGYVDWSLKSTRYDAGS